MLLLANIYMSIRSDYKKRRAELIMEMRQKGFSYNKIFLALNGSITPQRIRQIVYHYETKVSKEKDKQKDEFMKDLLNLDK